MSRSHRRNFTRLASLLITLVMIVGTNIAISFGSGISHSRAGISAQLINSSPKPRTGISAQLINSSPKPRAGISAQLIASGPKP